MAEAGHDLDPSNLETVDRSFRTIAFTTSVIFLMVWMFSLNTFVLVHVLDESLYADFGYETLGEVNYALAMFVTVNMIPTSVFLPVVFVKSKTRVLVSLAINMSTSILLIAYMVTAIVWAFICPTNLLLTNLIILAVQLLSSSILLYCMVYMSKMRMRRYKKEAVPGVYSAVGVDQGLHHASHVFAVFGAALLSTLGEGISNNRHTYSLTYPSFLPLLYGFLLLVVQMKHYTRTHVGWFNMPRAKKRVDSYLRQYALTELEKELVNEKKLTSRIIEGLFTVKIYGRPSWAC